VRHRPGDAFHDQVPGRPRRCHRRHRGWCRCLVAAGAQTGLGHVGGNLRRPRPSCSCVASRPCRCAWRRTARCPGGGPFSAAASCRARGALPRTGEPPPARSGPAPDAGRLWRHGGV
jgi:hypothetical protein